MTTPLANYQNERKAFEALFQPDCQKRILMFRGESGSGKTSLLRYCLKRLPESVAYVPIQLRGSAVSVAEIFHRAGRLLQWDRLPNFTRLAADLRGIPRVEIHRNWLGGINNHISVALQSEDHDVREHRRAALTDAWFDDLKTFDQSILFALDAYEKATTDVQEWISGPFLARASQSDIVRVMVAGQTIPDEKNIEWGHCCETKHLLGVPEAEDVQRQLHFPLTTIRIPVPLNQIKRLSSIVCYSFLEKPLILAEQSAPSITLASDGS